MEVASPSCEQQPLPLPNPCRLCTPGCDIVATQIWVLFITRLSMMCTNRPPKYGCVLERREGDVLQHHSRDDPCSTFVPPRNRQRFPVP